MTNFKERTNILLYKNIPLTLYSKGLILVVCERWCWRRKQTATYWPKVLLATIAALLPHLGWAAQPWVAEGPSPLSGAGFHSAEFYLQLRLELNWHWLELTQAVYGTWLYNCLTSTCFLWAHASAPNSTTSTGQGDIPTSLTGCICLTVLLLIYTGASPNWRIGRGSICYIIIISFCIIVV